MSLQAPEQDRRLEQIEDKFRNTFDWIYDRTEPGFSDWLQRGTGLFWINGKPGSGKSTLMKFIFKDHRTSDLLTDWRRDTTDLCAAFFFHYRGTALQKSFEGLLRSILSQIISQRQSLCEFLTPLFDKEHLTSDDWTLPILQNGFYSILRQTKKPLYLTLFLDALDEYDGRLEFICRFLKDVIEIPRTATKRIKICFSSRPWDIFNTEFQHSPGFSIQDFTQADIRDYCLGSIMEERLSAIALEDLIPDLVTRARGVFLWVKLVVKDLAGGIRMKMSKADLERLLESVPTELDKYYAEIIERIPRVYRWKAYAMLEIAVRSKESLKPEDFFCAVECSEFRTYQDGRNRLLEIRARVVEDFATLVKRQSRMICGGLIEVLGVASHYNIQVLHQTVEDFVTDPKFKRLVLEDRAKITVENGNSFLAKYRLLKTEISNAGENLMEGARYARAAEQTSGRSIRTFLDSVPSNVFAQGHPVLGDPVIATALGYAAFAGLRLYIIESLAVNPNLLRESKELLLSLVVKPNVPFGDEEFVSTARLLLDRRYTLNQDPTAFSSLILKIYYGGLENLVNEDQDITIEALHLDLVELLIDRGIPPNMSIFMARRTSQLVECKPLHISPPPLARLLLDKGAAVNDLDSEGMTPLDYVCSRKVVNGPNLAGTGVLRWDTRPADYEEIYELTCLLVERGGVIKKTNVRAMKLRLDEFLVRGWPTNALRERMLPPPKSLTQSLKSKLKRMTFRSAR